MTRVIEGKAIDINDVSSSQSSYLNDVEDMESDQERNGPLKSDRRNEDKDKPRKPSERQLQQ